MKLEAAMYIRTINGIQKFIKESADVYAFDKGVIIKPDNVEKYVIKASHNIIDLIEVGDYVNGFPVCLIKKDENSRTMIYTDSNYQVGILENEIETILTKEQFENNCYKVGD